MRHLAQHIILVICLLTQFCAWGQEENRVVFDLKKEGSTYRLSFRISDFSAHIDRSGFTVVESMGMTTAATPSGAPSLPTISRLVMLPRGTVLSEVRAKTHADSLLPLSPDHPLLPGAQPASKDDPDLSRTIDRMAYAQCSHSRHVPVRLQNLGVMGDRQVYRLSVHPFSYSDSLQSIAIYGQIEATFVAENSPSSDCGKSTSTGEMLIVARSDFRNGLQPFVRWKRQEGYQVHELYVETHRRDSIHPLIVAAAEQMTTAMPYLLLVGDVAQIQAYTGNTQPSGFDLHSTDLHYADHTGDYLPDMIVGRWPVNDTSELDIVVRKTLRYEQCIEPDSLALQQILLVAGSESTPPAPVTTNGQVNYLKKEVKKTHPDVDTLCYYNPSSSTKLPTILNHISQGTALLNYTAHCTASGWNNPSLRKNQLDTLPIAWPTLWVNNCCKSNMFNGTCFGEQLLRMDNGGAVAVIGATNNTMWNEDYYWAVGPKYPFSLTPTFDSLTPGAFDHLWDTSPDGTTAGELLLEGNLAVTAFGSPYANFYWEIYCLLGDPSLRPYIGMPDTVSLTLADTLHVGATTVHIQTRAGAMVTLLQADSLLGSAVADSTGVATLDLLWCIDTGEVLLTASGAGIIPKMMHLTPDEATQPLGIHQIAVTDSTLCCTIANLQSTDLHNVTVMIAQDSTDTLEGAIVSSVPITIDSLTAHQHTTICLAYKVVSVGQRPLWSGTLMATTDSAQTPVAVRHTLVSPYPSVSFRVMEEDGTAARHLEQGHTYSIQTIVDGTHDSLWLTVVALPDKDTLLHTSSTETLWNASILTPDTLTHLHMAGTLYRGNHLEHFSHYLVAGDHSDHIEEGMGSYPWYTTGTKPWHVDSTTRRDGAYSLRSGTIEYRQTSDLLIEVDVLADDSVSFWARTSCEETYDLLRFSIDGKTQGNTLSGETGWRHITLPISAGHHTLRWRYMKDESNDEGEDCAWIDHITLPLSLWDAPYGWFGKAQNLDIVHPTVENSLSPILAPNPSDGLFTMHHGTGITALMVYDLYGRCVYTTAGPLSDPAYINLQHLPDGIYMLCTATASGYVTHKITIQH